MIGVNGFGLIFFIKKEFVKDVVLFRRKKYEG